MTSLPEGAGGKDLPEACRENLNDWKNAAMAGRVPLSAGIDIFTGFMPWTACLETASAFFRDMLALPKNR